jgi:hypothetical protein
MAFISDADWTGLQTALFVGVVIVCGFVPGLLAMTARRDNGFATLWDLASGTRVVIKPKGAVRASIEPRSPLETPADDAESLGPYRIIRELVPERWIVAADPVLRRPVWLLRRAAEGLSPARRSVARPGRLRWLQKVESDRAVWDAFEATPGVPFVRLLEERERVPWSTLRYWLDDLASELWIASGDDTLPVELSLDHVWVTAEGRAVLLDEPWPDVTTPAEPIPVGDVAGQQRFLNAFAVCVESTSVPLHARPVLRNLEDGKFGKLSFLTGNLRGMLDRPAEVSRGIRAGSIFMLPLYLWVAIFVGRYHDKPWSDALGGIVISALVALGAMALSQLLALPFRGTVGHAIFRLAVLNARGQPAHGSELLLRWAIVWLPLFLPIALVALLIGGTGSPTGLVSALAVLLVWVGASIHAVVHPHRGLHDRLAGTWVVRR